MLCSALFQTLWRAVSPSPSLVLNQVCRMRELGYILGRAGLEFIILSGLGKVFIRQKSFGFLSLGFLFCKMGIILWWIESSNQILDTCPNERWGPSLGCSQVVL